MITVEEALQIVLARSEPLADETVTLAQASGRFLAEDIHCDADAPPFDRAMMDGYALRSVDTRTPPARLSVVGEVRAGQMPERGIEAGQALRIMTGAPLPPGADAIEPVERARDLGGERVEVTLRVEPGQHIAPRGCEVRAGTRVLERGLRIDPAAIAALATAGTDRVRVGRRPRVALLVTGDELVEVGARPEGAQIRNANGPALLAQIQDCGAQAMSLGVAADDSERIAAGVETGLGADVLVLSGGVSAGAYDLVEAVLARFGVEVFFERVAIKPGAPIVFGRRGRVLVFGLPGNPVSAQVTFDVFVRPALFRLQGGTAAGRPVVETVLGGPVRNRSRRKAYLPAVVSPRGGRLIAMPLPSAGSADVFAHARANALLILEADRLEAHAGEAVRAMLLRRFAEGERD